MTQPVSREDIIDFVREAGARYWPSDNAPADPYASSPYDATQPGQRWVNVVLPDWLADLGVGGVLWIDTAAIVNGDGNEFERCDWYLAAFSYLAALGEQHHERRHGPAHSFATRLNIPGRCFEYAWANRILLVMRRLEARRRGVDEIELFGALPDAEIRLTYDVDALDKTLPIRLKQSAFELFNLLRFLITGNFIPAMDALRRGLRIAFTNPDYCLLDSVTDAAVAHGLKATFHLHFRGRKRRLKHWLMDPGYHADDARLLAFVRARSAQGFVFGLHPSFDSWQSAEHLQTEREALQQLIGQPIVYVRQHWLRFSWKDTWRAQAQAGLTHDSTLGFNDRNGFRCGAALEYQPWHMESNRIIPLHCTPMILMDSHLYSYHPMDDAARHEVMRALIAEVHAVHGVATVLWHPHTLSADYGWQKGYFDLLQLLSERSL